MATYSLSLSEDKEDFLIDDEIADQPELVFEEQQYIPELIDKVKLGVSRKIRVLTHKRELPTKVSKVTSFLQNRTKGPIL